ncbi:signal peptidase I [Isobaculum melis]|uniref:Signal peptidase I n=2 Tax=Isobaculum melis TaxID=142588 RepID=A0A1H9S561_9LACT|nr:signal peptidase I [Isobaculum melis]
MMPTFHNLEEVIVAKNKKTIKRFDVIVFQHGEKDKYIKRVIGLPGESLYYQDGILYINHQKVEDPYHEGNENFTLYETAEVMVIPPNQYFVLGDNRKNSYDSRSYGLINQSDLIGIVDEGVKE